MDSNSASRKASPSGSLSISHLFFSFLFLVPSNESADLRSYLSFDDLSSRFLIRHIISISYLLQLNT
ncbi:hypothetical protein CsSME_00041999 [Camellia sinensis var. sinensis]